MLILFLVCLGGDNLNKWFTALVTAIAAAASYLLGLNGKF